MVSSPALSPAQPERDLLGQTLVVIGGSAGIGLETARLAREEGADVIITARNPDGLHRAALELGASIAAFDATDFDRLKRFFDELPAPIDHVLVAGPEDQAIAIDVIPDLIPILGCADDAIVVVLVLRSVCRRVSVEELREAWPGSDDGFAALCH